jgi:hypothetical protein
MEGPVCLIEFDDGNRANGQFWTAQAITGVHSRAIVGLGEPTGADG